MKCANWWAMEPDGVKYRVCGEKCARVNKYGWQDQSCDVSTPCFCHLDNATRDGTKKYSKGYAVPVYSTGFPLALFCASNTVVVFLKFSTLSPARFIIVVNVQQEKNDSRMLTQSID